MVIGGLRLKPRPKAPPPPPPAYGPEAARAAWKAEYAPLLGRLIDHPGDGRAYRFRSATPEGVPLLSRVEGGVTGHMLYVVDGIDRAWAAATMAAMAGAAKGGVA